MSDIQSQIKDELARILVSLGAEVKDGDILLTPTGNPDHGDYASNLALRKAKALGMKPIDLANKIVTLFKLDGVDHLEAAMPGFLNFYLAQDALGSIIKKIVTEKDNYGNLTLGKGKKVDIEYVSANPTGSLHLGHARGAALGDCLARLYKKAGYAVTREYYVNDAGVQMDHLAESLMIRYLELYGIQKEFGADDYHGPEIIALAKQLQSEIGDSYLKDPESHLPEFKKYGGDHLLEAIKKDLHDFRVDQDVYSSEKAIRDRGDVEKVLEALKPSCYEKDGALWLNTTKDGDDKDRVLVKSDGSYTYLLPDIAYHNDKFARGFDLLVDLFGADHHGYVARLKASQKDLGHNPDALTVSLVQMVRLFKDGEEFKMSKRTGNAISMAELIEEVGVDAARYFFVSRSGNSHLDFDIDLAKKLGSENPVYYAQYTHARLCGIIANGKAFYPIDYSSDLLTSESEKDLLIALKDYPTVLTAATVENEPYKVTNYIHSLATDINEFYTKCRVLDDSNPKLSQERLGLVEACRIVLANALSMIAVSAPERMLAQDKPEETK
ncbi:MAG: arginine--tRNA ligase [Bacilli bacterium]|jgi:arginyl-tRNA synthetase|nr:arginine--tRNA ligase [Bacilli bacterium]